MSQVQVNEQNQMDEVKEDVLHQVTWLRKRLETLENVVNSESDETALKMKIGLLLDEIKWRLNVIEETTNIKVQTADLSELATCFGFGYGWGIDEGCDVKVLLEGLLTEVLDVSQYLLYLYDVEKEQMGFDVYDKGRYWDPYEYEIKEAIEFNDEVDEVLDRYEDEIGRFDDKHELASDWSDLFELALTVVASRHGYRVSKFKIDNVIAWAVYKPVIDP
jgi:hypothetical protein